MVNYVVKALKVRRLDEGGRTTIEFEQFHMWILSEDGELAEVRDTLHLRRYSVVGKAVSCCICRMGRV